MESSSRAVRVASLRSCSLRYFRAWIERTSFRCSDSPGIAQPFMPKRSTELACVQERWAIGIHRDACEALEWRVVSDHAVFAKNLFSHDAPLVSGTLRTVERVDCQRQSVAAPFSVTFAPFRVQPQSGLRGCRNCEVTDSLIGSTGRASWCCGRRLGRFDPPRSSAARQPDRAL